MVSNSKKTKRATNSNHYPNYTLPEDPAERQEEIDSGLAYTSKPIPNTATAIEALRPLWLRLQLSWPQQQCVIHSQNWQKFWWRGEPKVTARSNSKWSPKTHRRDADYQSEMNIQISLYSLVKMMLTSTRPVELTMETRQNIQQNRRYPRISKSSKHDGSVQLFEWIEAQ